MSARSPITTHVLDTARGRPAANLSVTLSRQSEDDEDGEHWQQLAERSTDADGRIADLLAPGSLRPGTYRLRFATASYFTSLGIDEFFYPWVELVFTVHDPNQHYHVPLLLAPFGYSTYRGS